MGGKEGEIAAERKRREFLKEEAGIGVGGEAGLERFEVEEFFGGGGGGGGEEEGGGKAGGN